MKTIFIITFCLILAAVHVRSQEIKTHEHSVYLIFLQIKEQANYGLVFKGPGLGYTYSASWENESRIFGYETRFVFNVPMTRKIIAASVNFVPAA